MKLTNNVLAVFLTFKTTEINKPPHNLATLIALLRGASIYLKKLIR